MSSELTRDEVDRMPGAVVLEFGASWCGICQGTRPLIDRALGQALDEQPELRRIWIEDGRGKRLGRSFRITLWPTLVVLRDGREVARVVRPRDLDAIRAALSAAR
jgi:thioredoxin 1